MIMALTRDMPAHFASHGGNAMLCACASMKVISPLLMMCLFVRKLCLWIIAFRAIMRRKR
jgi:hypothetical protein